MRSQLFLCVLCCYIVIDVRSQNVTCDPSCGPSATCVVDGTGTNICSCWSMFAGPTCEIEQSGDCGAVIFNSTELEVKHPPNVTEFRFQDNNLLIEIEGAFVNGRLETEVLLHDGSGDAVCRYPGPYWQKNLDHGNCKDVWRSEVPWEQLINCNWAEQTTDNAVKYASILRVIHREIAGYHREQEAVYRISEHTYPIAITFQTTITVSTDVTVFAPINLLAVITSQIFDPYTKTATIELTTSLQYPFKIASTNLTNVPNGYSVTATENTNYGQSCSGEDGSSCLQVYTLEVDATWICNVTGLYHFDVEFACHEQAMVENEGWCPLGDDNTGQIVLDVTSGDFCGEASIDVGLSGLLFSFEHTPDNPYSVVRSNFLIGSEVAFVAQLESDEEGIELTKTTILQVYVTYEGGSSFLYDRQIKPGGVTVDFRILEERDSWAAFYVKLLPPTFYVLTDRNKNFKVFCRLEVEYAGTVKRKVTVMFGNGAKPYVEDDVAVRQSEGRPVPPDSSSTTEARLEFTMRGRYENPEDDPYFNVGPPHPDPTPDEWNSEANFGKPKDAASRLPSALLHVTTAVALHLLLLLAAI